MSDVLRWLNQQAVDFVAVFLIPGLVIGPALIAAAFGTWWASKARDPDEQRRRAVFGGRPVWLAWATAQTFAVWLWLNGDAILRATQRIITAD